MAVQILTYDDKSFINENVSVADINKVKDSDMNEIKSVVNNNAYETSTNTTEINENSTNISGLQGTILYSNDSPSSPQSSITLSGSVSNYDYVDITYRNNNSLYKSVRIYKPNSKQVVLDIMYPDSSQNQIWVQSATILFSDTSVTKVSGRYAEAEVYAQAGFGRTDRIYIISIIGYKSGIFS